MAAVGLAGCRMMLGEVTLRAAGGEFVDADEFKFSAAEYRVMLPDPAGGEPTEDPSAARLYHIRHRLMPPPAGDPPLPQGAGRVRSDCHFRKAATKYGRKPGIKWLRCTAK